MSGELCPLSNILSTTSETFIIVIPLLANVNIKSVIIQYILVSLVVSRIKTATTAESFLGRNIYNDICIYLSLAVNILDHHSYEYSQHYQIDEEP